MTPTERPSTAPTTDAAPRDSASLVLLRDGDPGLEVLLLRRHQNSKVLGGMYVFPGGKLDPEDCDPAWHPWLDQTPEALHAHLNEPDTPPATATGLFVAALRETLEEVGLLLAEPLHTPHATPEAGLQGALQALEAPNALRPAFEAHQLRWCSRHIIPWSRWITPRTPLLQSVRFDTRFFLAALPPGQQAQHDAHEATEAVWMTPRDALARYHAGEIELVPPQLMSLAQLSHHATVQSAWQDALQRSPACVLPELFDDHGVTAMCYPGDPLHPIRERALPGPTRVRYEHKRFTPFNGFGGWFE